MNKHVSLIDEFFIPRRYRDLSTAAKYAYLKKLYDSGATHILLNNCRVFGPFMQPTVPWDISEAQKIATYEPQVTSVLRWVNTQIVINLADMDYKTLDVLIRIATGMLNKCDIPKPLQILFHDNMVENLHKEHGIVVISELPFQGVENVKRDSYSLYPTTQLVSATSRKRLITTRQCTLA